MDESKRLYFGAIGSTDTTVIDYTNGVVVKTILIGNNSDTAEKATLTFDGVAFIFDVAANSTLVLNNPVVCNTAKVKANTSLNVHISGIMLGGA